MAASSSGTPQSRKLGLKPGQRVGVDQAPPGWSFADPAPELVHVEATKPADIVLAFFTTADELPRRLPDLVQRIYPADALWIAWPRRAGGHGSDINRQHHPGGSSDARCSRRQGRCDRRRLVRPTSRLAPQQSVVSDPPGVATSRIRNDDRMHRSQASGSAGRSVSATQNLAVCASWGCSKWLVLTECLCRDGVR
jgi:hypothetical protein